MEQRLKLPVGIEFFDEIRTSGYYYIDKTKLIEQLLQNMGRSQLVHTPAPFRENTEHEHAEMLF